MSYLKSQSALTALNFLNNRAKAANLALTLAAPRYCPAGLKKRPKLRLEYGRYARSAA